MILSDRDLKEYINNGRIKFDPRVDMNRQVQPSSVDLRLGNEFRVFRYTRCAILDPKDRNSFADATKLEVMDDNDRFIVHPNEFVLGTTFEYVCVPCDLVARLEGRSSLGRLGIVVHSTAGYIDPGFEGRITLEIGNIGKMPIILYPKMRVCQIVFEKLLSECEIPYGAARGSKYQGQKFPDASKLDEDVEFRE